MNFKRYILHECQTEKFVEWKNLFTQIGRLKIQKTVEEKYPILKIRL